MTEEASDFVCNTLGAGEEEDFVVAIFHDLFKVLDHAVSLFELGDNFDDLGDSVIGREIHRADVDLDKVVEVVTSQLADFLGPSGGPHACLSVGADLADDFANLRFKPHVKHTIGLIKDQVRNTTQVSLSGFEHINETTRSSDAYFHTSSEVANLATFWDATVDTSVSNARRLAEFGDFLLDLNSKFSGWSKDKDNGTVARREKWLSVDVNDGGQAVGQGLAGPRLGNTDDVATRKSHGPALRLDRGGFSKALSLDLGHDIAGESSLIEGLDGSRNVAALNCDFHLSAEFIDIAL